MAEPNISDDDVYVAEHQELLAQLDLVESLDTTMDAAPDFDVIAALNSIEKED